MKKVYRHIGYYEGQDAKDMFCFDADSLVACMTAGPFHSSDGECESDIENLDDEEDKCLFSMTMNKEHLVRYSRGGNRPDADGWYIDVYRLTEVESDDQDKPNQDDLLDMNEEYCEYCGDYVYLDPEFKVHTCPECGKYIVACNLCPFQPEEAKCATCPLAKQAEVQNEAIFYSNPTTIPDFCQKYNDEQLSVRMQGFEVIVEVPDLGKIPYMLVYDSKYDHCKLFRRYAGGNSYTFAGPAINPPDMRLALRLVTGTCIVDSTPIYVKQLK